jgi:hypothetical protein
MRIGRGQQAMRAASTHGRRGVCAVVEELWRGIEVGRVKMMRGSRTEASKGRSRAGGLPGVRAFSPGPARVFGGEVGWPCCASWREREGVS